MVEAPAGHMALLGAPRAASSTLGSGPGRGHEMARELAWQPTSSQHCACHAGAQDTSGKDRRNMEGQEGGGFTPDSAKWLWL